MRPYVVSWMIDIDADNPEEAAAQALITMRDTESTALFFNVIDEGGTTTDVDLRAETP